MQCGDTKIVKYNVLPTIAVSLYSPLQMYMLINVRTCSWQPFPFMLNVNTSFLELARNAFISANCKCN